jgi:hypothetical protein
MSYRSDAKSGHSTTFIIFIYSQFKPLLQEIYKFSYSLVLTSTKWNKICKQMLQIKLSFQIILFEISCKIFHRCGSVKIVPKFSPPKVFYRS